MTMGEWGGGGGGGGETNSPTGRDFDPVVY